MKGRNSAQPPAGHQGGNKQQLLAADESSGSEEVPWHEDDRNGVVEQHAEGQGTHSISKACRQLAKSFSQSVGHETIAHSLAGPHALQADPPPSLASTTQTLYPSLPESSNGSQQHVGGLSQGSVSMENPVYLSRINPGKPSFDNGPHQGPGKELLGFDGIQHASGSGVPTTISRDCDSDAGSDDSEEEHQALIVRNKDREKPIVHRWNWWPLLLLIWFMGAAGFYFYVRITEINNVYGIFILAVELLGVTSFFPYALLITRGVYPTGTRGLPAAGTEGAQQMTPPARRPQPISGKAGGSAGTSSASTPTHLRHRGSAAHGSNLAKSSTATNGHATYIVTDNDTSMQHNAGLVSIAMTPTYKNTVFTTTVSEPAVSEASFGMLGYRFHVRVLIPCYKEPLEVVAATLNAARGAALPAYTRRTIYLCDDGKDPKKKELVASLGPDVHYVSGRRRKMGEINGKSANLNNCLKNHIYKQWPRNDDGEIDWAEISNKELVIVFDADMCAKQELYLRLLEVMMDDDLALVLSPQSFHNISPDADLFNNINKQFWECWLPGAFAWGYIACTGTNFCIRARALAHCGWFPDYTITEDYALGMELKSNGYKATYLMLYLAEGEAPEEIRNVFRQRSRWNKGHFQVFFSWRNPLINFNLPFFQRLWYSYAAWAPICTIITIPTFMMVPFMSIVFGFNPVTITFRFVLSSTIYYMSLALIQNYAYESKDRKLMWFANGSNTVLWFTYFKALCNSWLSILGFKALAFKVTEKVKPQAEGAVVAAAVNQPKPSVMNRMLSMVGRPRPSTAPGSAAAPLLPNTPTNTNSSAGRSSKRSSPKRPNMATQQPANRVEEGTGKEALLADGPQNSSDGKKPAAPILGSAAYVRGATPLPSSEKEAPDGWKRFKAVMASFKPANVRDFDEMFDPIILFLLFCFSAGTFAFGMWQTVLSINARAPASFAFNSPMKGSPYLIISTAWAFFNMIFPYLFLHYCITAKTSFKYTATALMYLSHLILVGSIVLIWMLIPTDFDLRAPLDLQLTQYIPSQVIKDSGTKVQFVQGIDQQPVFLSLDFTYLNALSASLKAASATQSPRRSLLSLDEDPMDHLTSHLGNDDVLDLHLFDPAGVTDADLKGDDAMSAWHRSLLQSFQSASSAAVNLPQGVDISGGLLVKDHVKYAQPMAYAVTQLAWSVLQFPQGFTPMQYSSALTVIRAGAEYLVRCLLKTASGKFIYIAQVGDPLDYLAVENMTTDPSVAGMIWTSPQQDPYLNGKLPRKVWILDEAHVGSDLLANVAAALAASSEVFRPIQPTFSTLALKAAQQVYSLASTGQPSSTRPHSYCEYIPCTANITVNKQLLTVPAKNVQAKLNAEPMCYFVDWITFTCQTLHSTYDCTQKSSTLAEVYKTKIACCSKLAATGVWDKLATRAQGICAVPDGQFSCYIPDNSARACFEHKMDNMTGVGCYGPGLDIYASPVACCNALSRNGIIDAQNGKPGTGLCSRANLDPTFKQCYIPNLTNATCEIRTGAACSTFGIQTVYDEATPCCKQLYEQMAAITILRIKPLGICALPENATMPGSNGGFDFQQPVTSTSSTTIITIPAPNTNPAAPAPPAAVITQVPNPPPTTSASTAPATSATTPTTATGSTTGSTATGTTTGSTTTDTTAPAPATTTPTTAPADTTGTSSTTPATAPAPTTTPTTPAPADTTTAPTTTTTTTPAPAPTPTPTTPAPTTTGTTTPAPAPAPTTTTTTPTTAPAPAPAPAPTTGRRSLLANDVPVNETDWLWDPKQQNIPPGEIVCQDNACDVIPVPRNVTVAFYNSTSTLDDMAWGGVWLYRASKDARYLGEAQRYLERHYQEDITAQTLNSDRSYYISDWNNLAWATNLMLYQLTGSKAYDARIRTLLNSWVFGNNVPKQAGGLPAATTGVQLSVINALGNFTDPNSGDLVYIVPSCTASNSYEIDCFDGIDNDCDGMIDREDVDCGLFPVVYTETELAYSQAPSLPHAAAASWLGMVYAESQDLTTARKLRCWALGQVAYMMGGTPGTRSYIVGFKDAPEVVQHRASSCPAPLPGSTDQQICTWDNAYWPTVPNPQLNLVAGALLAGPGRHDEYRSERSNEQTSVSLDGTMPLTGVLAGLLQTGTGLRSCELMHGLYQRLSTDESL